MSSRDVLQDGEGAERGIPSRSHDRASAPEKGRLASRPRLIIADDHRVFAEGLQGLLSQHYEITEIVEDGMALVEAVAARAPDLVVADVSMPGLNGIECVRVLRASDPELKIVLLTMHEDAGLATAAIRAGAKGYVLKHSGIRDLLRALDEALRGGVYVTAGLAAEVERALDTDRDSRRELTPRPREIPPRREPLPECSEDRPRATPARSHPEEIPGSTP